MESVALLAHARRAGLAVRLEGGRLIVRGPKRLADLAASLLDRKDAVVAALDAEADPGVVMVLDVFPGARVVAASQPAVWPPEGGWVPSPGKIDPYAAEPPRSPCPCCGTMAWSLAGTGFTCGVCHPPPGGGQAASQDDELDTALFGLAERAGFPRLALSPAVTVLAGKDAWRRFTVLTTSPSLRAKALAGLHDRHDSTTTGMSRPPRATPRRPA
jgi:hypothetical protein